MTQIAFTRAHDVSCLSSFLDRDYSIDATERIFSQAGIPLQVINEPDTLIPYRDVFSLYDKFAYELGNQTLGISLAEKNGFAGFGSWGKFLLSSKDLELALLRASMGIQHYQSHAGINIEKSDGKVKVAYYNTMNMLKGWQHHAQKVIGTLIDLAKSFIGQFFKPDRIELDYSQNNSRSALEDSLKAPILFGQRSVSIVFPEEYLKCKKLINNDLKRNTGFNDTREFLQSKLPVNFIDSVRAIIRLMLMEGKTDIETVSQKMNMGTRTLQRRLQEQGASFRSIMDDVLMQRAIYYLHDPEKTITDIAFSLGYQNSNHFTRAFKRWTGLSPREMRKIYQIERDRKLLDTRLCFQGKKNFRTSVPLYL